MSTLISCDNDDDDFRFSADETAAVNNFEFDMIHDMTDG